MIDKRTAQLLTKLNQLCADGSYKIIEKTELRQPHNSADISAVTQMIRYLQDNEFIDVKYTDENVFCLTVLPKGRVAVENVKNKSDRHGVDKKTLAIWGIIYFMGAFLGALFATILARLF
jgi:DNA-binding MarR family transcriptional regulator